MAESDGDRHLPEWRAPMDLEGARRRQMRAVKTAERIMYDAYEEGDDELALTAATRLTQAVRCYVKVVEASEIEERISALESAVQPSGDGAPHTL